LRNTLILVPKKAIIERIKANIFVLGFQSSELAILSEIQKTCPKRKSVSIIIILQRIPATRLEKAFKSNSCVLICLGQKGFSCVI